jgi:colicin import membrane protein
MTRHAQLPAVRRLRRRRPTLSGDLDQVLSEAPCFRRRLTGYDRLQVDTYVSWAEEQLLLAGRELDDLARRLGRCTAELQRTEERMATSPAGWELGRVSERVGEILRLAADEAANLVEAGVAESERLRTQAEESAAATLRQAQEVRAVAAAEGDRMREEARAAREEAEATLGQARTDVALLAEVARAERARVAAESAEALDLAAQDRASARSELALAQSRRAQTEQVLERLTSEMDAALVSLSGPPPNVVALLPVEHPVPGPDTGGEPVDRPRTPALVGKGGRRSVS